MEFVDQERIFTGPQDVRTHEEVYESTPFSKRRPYEKQFHIRSE